MNNKTTTGNKSLNPTVTIDRKLAMETYVAIDNVVWQDEELTGGQKKALSELATQVRQTYRQWYEFQVRDVVFVDDGPTSFGYDFGVVLNAPGRHHNILVAWFPGPVNTMNWLNATTEELKKAGDTISFVRNGIEYSTNNYINQHGASLYLLRTAEEQRQLERRIAKEKEK